MKVILNMIFFHLKYLQLYFLSNSLQEELQRKGGGGGGGSRKSRKKRVQKEDGTYGMFVFIVCRTKSVYKPIPKYWYQMLTCSVL